MADDRLYIRTRSPPRPIWSKILAMYLTLRLAVKLPSR
jgi:hypothetical protein